MSKFKSILLSCFLLVHVAMNAQNMYITFKNTTIQSYPFSQIRNITFTSDTMNLNLLNGTTTSWNVGSIQNYRFDEKVSGIESLEKKAVINKVEIYPNPSSGSVTIGYELLQTENVNIEISDIHGRLVKQLVNQEQKAGKQFATWDATDNSNKSIAKGIYLCRLFGGSFSTVKSVIIN